MRIDFAWLSLPFVRAARIFLVPQRFFLFRVQRESRLAATLLSQHSGVDMLKLRITIGMLLALQSLDVAAQRVTHAVEQAADRGMADAVASSYEFLG